MKTRLQYVDSVSMPALCMSFQNIHTAIPCKLYTWVLLISRLATLKNYGKILQIRNNICKYHNNHYCHLSSNIVVFYSFIFLPLQFK
jgi:hypothetical protein